jgi:hypothetical protein
MEWVVINWNEPAKEVYRKMGAEHVRPFFLLTFPAELIHGRLQMHEWNLMRLTGDSLKKLAE